MPSPARPRPRPRRHRGGGLSPRVTQAQAECPLPPCGWERQLSKSPPWPAAGRERESAGRTVDLTRLLPSRPGALRPRNVSRGSRVQSAHDGSLLSRRSPLPAQVRLPPRSPEHFLSGTRQEAFACAGSRTERRKS